jgi:hypothetical protein
MLADIPRILTDPVHRRACLRHVDDPSLLGFWEHYDKLSPGAQAQMVGPVMNKLRVVLTRPFVAAVSVRRSRASTSVQTSSTAGCCSHACRRARSARTARPSSGASSSPRSGRR